MSSVDRAFETQLNNIQKRTGKTLDELFDIIRKSGLTKHGEIVGQWETSARHSFSQSDTVDFSCIFTGIRKD